MYQENQKVPTDRFSSGMERSTSLVGASMAEREPAIPRVLNRIEEECVALHQIIGIIDDRLSPFSRPQTPAASSVGISDPEPFCCDAARFLSARLESIREARHRIEYLLDRLEV